MKQAILFKIKNAPKGPGIYVFYGGRPEKSELYSNVPNIPLYVGKAANLRNRLKSYLKVTDIKTASLHEEATRLEYIILRSNIEALIEESRLIKELKPKYNVLWRDDKSYLYVYFTDDVFSKVFVGHERQGRIKNYESSRIGQFTDGNALRLVMKLLRRYFPYCTCKQMHLRDCLNAQIAKCFGYCCINDTNIQMGANDTNNLRIYRKNIRTIKAVLRGQSKKLFKTLKNEKEKEALEKILAHKEFLATSGVKHETSNLPHFTFPISRIECYDISNLAGKEAVGAMTVLKRHMSGIKNQETWVADKSQWRKFKIKSAPTRDDPRMIAEVVSRRLNHPEWPYPDLIIIDGGLTQYRAAAKALASFKNKESRIMNNCDKNSKPIIHNSLFSIQLLSFAKPQQKIIGMENPSPELQKLVEQAIYQTHNFVIRYHRKVRAKAFLGK